VILRLVAMITIGIVATAGCRSVERPSVGGAPSWDLEAVEFLEWQADDPVFSQNRELEASGMTLFDGSLIVSVETYGRLLFIDPVPPYRARVVRLDVPVHSELEGVTVADGIAYICDEAHAAVHAVDLAAPPTKGPMGAEQLPLRGISVRGGKIGFEGVAASADGSAIYLLLERSGNERTGCVSKIFTMRIGEDELVADGDPLTVELEDCNWRLTGLEMRDGELLALKTQFPGERYEVVSIDTENGDCRVVLEMTEFMRSVRAHGWGNNVEGIAIGEDGALYLVGDNAVTDVVDAHEPPVTDEISIFLRIPARRR
jgi:hypothetical protein